VLEIGCGSGGYAVHLAKSIGCEVLGLDINADGVRNAKALAEKDKVDERVTFEQCDVSQRLSVEDNAFDAIYSNDVLCHIPRRSQILSDLRRVLKPGGRLLFSDALIVGGLVSNEEIAIRSSIGMYVFSPPGENERLIKQSGLKLIETRDTTDSAALLSKRWHGAREKRKAALVASEGEANFAGIQRFLECVHTLTVEKRLRRFLYIAIK
jgi:SAM-dependent methyltransferase